jgi:hypothetical protein
MEESLRGEGAELLRDRMRGGGEPEERSHGGEGASEGWNEEGGGDLSHW